MGIGYHTACTRCTSSDAMYVYPDGSNFCFSCRTGDKTLEFKPQALEEPDDDILTLPPGCTQDYAEEAVEWFSKCDLGVEDMMVAKVVWCERSKQLIFPWYDDFGNLLAYQARNFSPTAKAKAYTKGDVKSLLPIYREQGDTVVLVEDPLSAIKVRKYSGLSSMPLLGNTISNNKLAYLAKFYNHILVWLDSDMLHKSMEIVSRLNCLGTRANTIYTEKDPKHCNCQQELAQKTRLVKH